MKKLGALTIALVVPALSTVVVVPSVVFLVATLFFPLPFFLFEDLILGMAALFTVTLFGVAFGHNVTTSLLQGFLVGM